MKVTLLFFSVLRDITGQEEAVREIAEGETVASLLEGLVRDFPRLAEWEGKLLVAVDREYAGSEAVLRDGQEVAVMPPVQGG